MNIPFSFPPVNSTIAVTSTSQRIAMVGSGNQIVVKNLGTSECFIAVGDVTVVATAATTPAATVASDGSFSIPVGEVGTYTIPLGATHLAAVCIAAATTTLRVSRGEGV